MDSSEFPKNLLEETEILSQFENLYYSQREELKLYKKKCGELRVALDKVSEEKRELQLELINEKSAKEQALRNSKSEKERLLAQYTSKLGSAKMESEHWKQMAEAVGKEKQILCNQYKVVQSHKAEAVRQATNLQIERAADQKDKRSLEICFQNQKHAIQQLQSQYDLLTTAKDQLAYQLGEQEKQIEMFNDTASSMINQRKLDETKILELEKKLMESNATRAEQDQQQVSNFLVREHHSDALISKLKMENEGLLRNIISLTQSSNSSSVDSNILFVRPDEI